MIDPIIDSILCSLLPITELRGGIPLAVYRGISIYSAFIICVIANYFVIPFVFFFSYLDPVPTKTKTVTALLLLSGTVTILNPSFKVIFLNI